jgi:hypothetical protein
MSDISLSSLITETYEIYNKDTTKNCPTILLNLLKEKHLWPSIKVKKFKNESNLCLVHNSYKRDDVDAFRSLYDECRSVILDFSRSIGNNVVISYANSIPVRSSISNYTTNIYQSTDKSYIAMDGTLISVYFNNNKWHFGSSCCPDINGSKFSHPTKSHGYMLDEVLYEIYKTRTNIDVTDPNISTTLRNLFTSNLSPLFSYEFVLIHHENIHIIDYSKELGNNYKCLFHINTKNRITLAEENLDNKPLEFLGVHYPHKFQSPEEAIAFVSTNENSIIIKKPTGKLFKISSDKISHYDEVNANNYNKWYNLIYVYMLQKPNYNINQYVAEFLANEDSNLYKTAYDDIHTTFMIITEVIYNLYIATTNYYPKYKRFKVNLDLDRTLNPVMRFHLAQLRYQQTTIYQKAIITQKEIFDYLCHSNNIKNVKKIITHVYSNCPIYNLPQEIGIILGKINLNLSF